VRAVHSSYVRAFAALLIACSGLLAACGSGNSDGLPTVTVGVGNNVFDTPIRVAVDKGFFRAAGLDVKVVTVASANGAAALQSNSVRFLNDSPTDFINAVARGIPEIAVSMDGGGNPLGLVVSTRFAAAHGLTAQSPPDVVARALPGSTGGASSATTKGQANILLREYGVDPATVRYVTLTSPAADKAALANNLIDWFVTSEPIPLDAQADGDGLVLAGPDTVPVWSFPRTGYGQVIVARQSFAEENPDLVRRFVGAVARASAYTRDHETEALGVLKQTLTGNPDPVLLTSLRLVDWPRTGAMSAADWATTVAFISKEGAIPPGTAFPSDAWTNQYLPPSP
jgi:ABC-type nitrate/sulfonate/bicarbonate transport system substrate-binding protein